jgi:hypothetical protein
MGERNPGRRSLDAHAVMLTSSLVRTAMAVIFVAGCTSMGARTAADYDKGSAPKQNFDKDSDACVKQAEAHQKEHGYGPYDPTRGAYNYMYDLCMRSSGYQRKTQ